MENLPASVRSPRHRANRIIMQRLPGRTHRKRKYVHNKLAVASVSNTVNTLPFQFNIAAICALIAPEDPIPYLDIPIAGTETTFKCLLDSGSTSFIMTIEQYRELGCPQPFVSRPQRIVTASDKSGLSIL